ncbi:MAG: hypothetical protein AAF321_03820 [Pseudomonadota bacterium]
MTRTPSSSRRAARAPADPLAEDRDRRGAALDDLAASLGQAGGCCGQDRASWYWDDACDPERCERCRDRRSDAATDRPTQPPSKD